MNDSDGHHGESFFVEPGGGDPELDGLGQIEKEEETKDRIRQELRAELAQQGVDTNSLTGISGAIAEAAGSARQPQDPVSEALQDGFKAVVDTIYSFNTEVKGQEASLEARKGVFVAKINARLSLADFNVPSSAREVLVGALNKRVPVKLDSREQEFDIFVQIAAEREALRSHGSPN